MGSEMCIRDRAETPVEIVVSEFSLVLASQLEAQQTFFENLLAERAEAARAELVDLRARTDAARAELERRAADGVESEATARLRARDADVAADEAALRVLQQLNARLLTEQGRERVALDQALARHAQLDAERLDVEDQLRDLAVHVRAHGALVTDALDGGVALPEARPQGGGRAGRHARHAQGGNRRLSG